MYWESWSDFIQMGRHGFYVWSCVVIILMILGAELLSLVKARRQALKKLHQLNEQAERASIQPKAASQL